MAFLLLHNYTDFIKKGIASLYMIKFQKYLFLSTLNIEDPNFKILKAVQKIKSFRYSNFKVKLQYS